MKSLWTNRASKGYAGFTIIEFLIIIGLIGIITTVSIAAYTTFTETSKLKNEVQKFIAVVTLTQKKVLAGDTGTGCLNCSLINYTIDLNASTQIYTVAGSRLNASSQTEAFNQTANSVESVNRNITFLTTATITLLPLTAAPGSAQNVVFKNVVNNTCTQVTIATSGLISSASISCP